jgi:hypothetical protein
VARITGSARTLTTIWAKPLSRRPVGFHAILVVSIYRPTSGCSARRATPPDLRLRRAHRRRLVAPPGLTEALDRIWPARLQPDTDLPARPRIRVQPLLAVGVPVLHVELVAVLAWGDAPAVGAEERVVDEPHLDRLTARVLPLVLALRDLVDAAASTPRPRIHRPRGCRNGSRSRHCGSDARVDPDHPVGIRRRVRPAREHQPEHRQCSLSDWPHRAILYPGRGCR